MGFWGADRRPACAAPRPRAVVRLACGAVLALVACAIPRVARADGRLRDRDTFAVHSTGDVAVDGGLVVGFPAALPTGLSKGAGVGVTQGRGGVLAWGARASWSTATESSISWTVTQWDLRLRAIAELRHRAGRGTIALRGGIGATVVHEHRVRNQGSRAGLTGSDLETSAVAALPAADLEAVVAVHVAGPWVLVMSGGPSVDLRSGALHGGWIAGLGVAWQP